MTTYLGLDLSLTATGCAVVTPTRPGATTETAWRIRPKGTGPARLVEIREAVATTLALNQPLGLVAVEGYAYGRHQGAAHLGELGGVIRVLLHEAGVRWVIVPPSSLKKYATGTGTAKKEAVLAAAIRRLGYAGCSTDEADALWLAHAAAELDGHPVIEMPALNRAGLRGVSE